MPSLVCWPRNSDQRKSASIPSNPGMVETEGTHSAGFIGSDFEKAMVAQSPLGRIGQTGRYCGNRRVLGIQRFALANRRAASCNRRYSLNNFFGS